MKCRSIEQFLPHIFIKTHNFILPGVVKKDFLSSRALQRTVLQIFAGQKGKIVVRKNPATNEHRQLERSLKRGSI